MQRPIAALIFDLDGVLTDTVEYHYLAWKRLADEEGLPFGLADKDALRGLTRRASLLRVLQGKALDEATMQAWQARKHRYFQGYMEAMSAADLLPGVLPLLEEARALGLRLGVGSASQNAKPILQQLQVSHLFGMIGDASAVVNHKPAPDIFVWVAGALGVPVQQAIVFEDAEAGVDAARAAGCLVVGLGTAPVSHADLCLPTLAETRLADLLAALGAEARPYAG